MGSVIMFNLVSLDGYFEGINHDIRWHQVDEEFNQFSIQQLKKAEGLIFGRLTYQLMANYWPKKQAIESDPIVAGLMNSLPKYVFSKTLKRVEWNNSQLMQGTAEEALIRLKNQSAKDLFIFGSANLSGVFTKKGLIDEYRLMVNPIVLGNGTPLFKDNSGWLKMKLLRTKIFGNGNILLSYQAEGK